MLGYAAAFLAEIEDGVTILEGQGHQGAIPAQTALAVARAKAEGEPLSHQDAGALGGRGNKASNNITGFSDRGTSATYLARRLKRDAPEVFSRLEQGEYKSVRAAAIEAGIVKPPTALDLLRRAWARATVEERAAFTKEIGL
jgi:hypothetical protein